jgi:MYXO-CTERM domain-containing protein
MPRLGKRLLVLLVGPLAVLAPIEAHAHFKLNAPMSWMSQDSIGGPQKNGPCAAVPNTNLGDSQGTPTGIVNAFQPGQTITVSVTATVPHPGWYRIALVQGPSSGQTLTSLPDPQAMAGTNCTPPILMNPVWSTTQPVLADGLGLPAGSTDPNTQQSGTKMFQVTIPQNASCTAARPCSLQVIMVMTDHPATDCYYHHCADITAQTSATGGAGGTAGGAGGTAGGAGGTAGAGGAGGSTASGSGGHTGTGGATTTSGSGGQTGTGTGGATTTAGSGGQTGGGGSAPTTGSAGNSGGDTGGSPGGGNGNSSGGCSVAGGSVESTALGLALLALTVFRRRRK